MKTIYQGKKIEVDRKGKFFDTTYFIYIRTIEKDFNDSDYLALNFKTLDRKLTSSKNFKKLLTVIDSVDSISFVFKGDIENVFIHENFTKSKAVYKFLNDSHFSPAFRAAVVIKYWIKSSKYHDFYNVESYFENLVKTLKESINSRKELISENNLTGRLLDKATCFMSISNLNYKYNKNFDLCYSPINLIKEKLLLAEMLKEGNRHDTLEDFLKENKYFDPSKFKEDTGLELIFEEYEKFIKKYSMYKNMTSGEIVYRMMKDYTASNGFLYTAREPEDYSRYYTLKHLSQISTFPVLYLFDENTAEVVYNVLVKSSNLFYLYKNTLEINHSIFSMIFEIKDKSPYFNEWCDTFLNTLIFINGDSEKVFLLLSDFSDSIKDSLNSIYDFKEIICNEENFSTPLEWLMSIHLSEETLNLNNYIKSVL